MAIQGAHRHHYAKDPRPGRKVGHLTLRRDTREELLQALPRVQALADSVNVLA